MRAAEVLLRQYRSMRGHPKKRQRRSSRNCPRSRPRSKRKGSAEWPSHPQSTVEQGGGDSGGGGGGGENCHRICGSEVWQHGFITNMGVSAHVRPLPLTPSSIDGAVSSRQKLVSMI